MSFRKSSYIQRILELFKENNHFWGYLGEYLGGGVEIFRIGVSYEPQKYTHYRIRDSAREPIHHRNPVRPYTSKFCARFVLKRAAKFTFCAATPVEIYHKTSGGPRQGTLSPKMFCAEKCHQFRVLYSNLFRENEGWNLRDQPHSQSEF